MRSKIATLTKAHLLNGQDPRRRTSDGYQTPRSRFVPQSHHDRMLSTPSGPTSSANNTALGLNCHTDTSLDRAAHALSSKDQPPPPRPPPQKLIQLPNHPPHIPALLNEQSLHHRMVFSHGLDTALIVDQDQEISNLAAVV